MYSRNTKTINESTASNNKSDRPQVNIWILKYLNINDSFHLKDLEISKYKRFFSLVFHLEISKYKRESKARMPIKFCCLNLLIVAYLAF